MLARIFNIYILAAAILLSNTIAAQSIVSTSPQTKRAVLEEFGGITCVYCPEGHQIINALKDIHGDNLISLNYQEGPFAIPGNDGLDLRSDYGYEILNQTGATGYPFATVNRQVFSGLEQGAYQTTAMSRSNWPIAVEEVLAQDSPVNIAAQANIDIANRTLEVYIEYYYTSDAPGEENLLNVAIVQNNILGPQHGGAQGNFYNHQRVVRDFVTGQWGHIITNNEAGTFGSLSYQLDLPVDYRDVLADLFNIEIVVFIAENEQNIFTGTSITPELHSSFAYDVNVLSVQTKEEYCIGQDFFQPYITIRNDGHEPLENLDINFAINGWTDGYIPWVGYLAPLEELEIPLFIDLPSVSGSYELNIHASIPNSTEDSTLFNNEKTQDFIVAPEVQAQALELVIKTDNFGYELYWEITDESEQYVYASGGNTVVGQTQGGARIASISDEGAYQANEYYIEDIYLPFDACYKLKVLDDYADGLCCNYGDGFYKLRIAGETAFIEGGEFSAKEEHLFSSSSAITSSSELEENTKSINIYPNPVKTGEIVHLDKLDNASSWRLIDYQGRVCMQGEQDSFSTNQLSAGFYIIQIFTQDQQTNYPLIIH